MDPRLEKFLILEPFSIEFFPPSGQWRLKRNKERRRGNLIFEGIKVFFFRFFLSFNNKLYIFDSWLSLNLFLKSWVFWHALECSLQHWEREGEEGEGRGQHDCNRQGRLHVSCCVNLMWEYSFSGKSFGLLFARTSDPDSFRYLELVWDPYQGRQN